MYQCAHDPVVTEEFLQRFVCNVLPFHDGEYTVLHLITCPACQAERRRLEEAITTLEIPADIRRQVFSVTDIPAAPDCECLNDDDFARMAYGTMPTYEQLSRIPHILACQRCRGALAALRQAAQMIFDLRDDRDQT